jgi:hypothetical protein
VAPSFFGPNVITIHLNNPMNPEHRNAVLCTSSLAMKIYLYLAFSSKKLITLLPDALLINILATGIGYSSLGVALFRFRKSTHICILLVPFFSTRTMFAIHSTYLQGYMNLAFNNQSTSSFTHPMILGL